MELKNIGDNIYYNYGEDGLMLYHGKENEDGKLVYDKLVFWYEDNILKYSKQHEDQDLSFEFDNFCDPSIFLYITYKGKKVYKDGYVLRFEVQNNLRRNTEIDVDYGAVYEEPVNPKGIVLSDINYNKISRMFKHMGGDLEDLDESAINSILNEALDIYTSHI